MPSSDVLDAFDLSRPFTVPQARAAGMTRAAVRHLLDSGMVRPVLRDVYVDASVRETIELRAAALAVVAPAHTVVCDQTAAWLHGVDLQREVDPFWLPPLETYRAGGHDGLRRDDCVRGKRGLDPLDVMEIGAVAVTTPLRTALDLGRLRRRHEAFAAMNALARAAGFGLPELAAELPRFRGMRGVVQLRYLAARVDPRLESPAESRVLIQLIEANLPLPEPQFVIVNAFGVEMFRLDFAYDELMVALEYDGVAFHTGDERERHDQERRARLEAMGWTFVVLTAADVYGAKPRAADLVRSALEAAERRRTPG